MEKDWTNELKDLAHKILAHDPKDLDGLKILSQKIQAVLIVQEYLAKNESKNKSLPEAERVHSSSEISPPQEKPAPQTSFDSPTSEVERDRPIAHQTRNEAGPEMTENRPDMTEAKPEHEVTEAKLESEMTEPRSEPKKVEDKPKPEARSSEADPQKDIPTLSDLFVPSFTAIKEDMSQKEEFKDTVSLDDTENMFQTKKEETKQLSLNDRLVGNSIQIGLNDRIAFVNKLFNFSQADFNRVLERLNAFEHRKDAMHFFEYQVKRKYNWKGKEDLEERFVELIERKFIK